jgi:Amt family ammonium transporter
LSGATAALEGEVHHLVRTLVIFSELSSGPADPGRALLLLAATVLVLAMAFGVWLFYSRTAPSGRRMFLTAGATALVWVLCGYGLVFGPALVPGFLGNPLAFAATGGLAQGGGAGMLVRSCFAAFQCAVAILAVTIVTSACGERTRRAPWLAFIAVWLIIGYSPIAYSVFNVADGWLFGGLQINDQAGGTVVHISAAAAILGLLVAIPRLRTTGGSQSRRHTLYGAGLLWIGAFGLNIGSEGVVDGLFGTIMLNTLIAPAVAGLAWWVVQLAMSGRPTIRGAASGVVAGVVAITPACNILTPAWTVLLGLLAGAVCAVAVSARERLRLGHGFETVEIHLVGGVIGLGYIGILGNGIGWKDSGQPDLIAEQIGAALGVALWSFLAAIVIALLLRKALVPRTELPRSRKPTLSSRS